MVVMDSYLMMLYVTLEQESALKNFFMEQGWTFCKPDLTMTTDKLGPSVGDGLSTSSDTGIGPRLTGKRKTRAKQTAPVAKMAKFVSPVNNKQATDPDRDKLKNTVKLNTGDTNKCSDVPVYVNKSDVKNENFDLSNICQKDGLDDDDEDSDIDNSYGETKEGDEDETDNSFRNVSNNEVENENVMKQAIPQIAAELRESEVVEEQYPSVQVDRKNRPSQHGRLVNTGILAPYPCRYCDSSFSSNSSKNRHENTVHLGMLKHICKICDKAFANKRLLDGHSRSVHFPETKFQCEICEKPFAFLYNLQVHLKICKRKHCRKCDICSEEFESVEALDTHLFTIHNIDRDISCAECNKTFSSKRSLLSHVKFKHVNQCDIVCDVCGERYQYPASLHKHRKKHGHFAAKEPGEL